MYIKLQEFQVSNDEEANSTLIETVDIIRQNIDLVSVEDLNEAITNLNQVKNYVSNTKY